LTIQAHQKLSAIIDQYREQGRPERLIITYIPSHRYRKKFVKGYNQSQILAEKIHERLLIPIIEILQKPGKTRSQALLNRKQRLTNLQ
jgi:predicted amidophosphoribosyltransferase